MRMTSEVMPENAEHAMLVDLGETIWAESANQVQ